MSATVTVAKVNDKASTFSAAQGKPAVDPVPAGLSQRAKEILALVRSLREKQNTVDSARSQVPRDNLNQGAVLELCFAQLVTKDEGMIFANIGPEKGSAGGFHVADGVYAKVSEKGALSLYGLQRLPVTLYSSQWERLLSGVDNIRAALVKYKGLLKEKPAKEDKEDAKK